MVSDRIVFREFFENPKGIPSLSPAVARNELPWVVVLNVVNPEGVEPIRTTLMQPRWG